MRPRRGTLLCGGAGRDCGDKKNMEKLKMNTQKTNIGKTRSAKSRTKKRDNSRNNE
jgi:hypothetical protein